MARLDPMSIANITSPSRTFAPVATMITPPSSIEQKADPSGRFFAENGSRDPVLYPASMDGLASPTTLHPLFHQAETEQHQLPSPAKSTVGLARVQPIEPSPPPPQPEPALLRDALFFTSVITEKFNHDQLGYLRERKAENDLLRPPVRISADGGIQKPGRLSFSRPLAPTARPGMSRAGPSRGRKSGKTEEQRALEKKEREEKSRQKKEAARLQKQERAESKPKTKSDKPPIGDYRELEDIAPPMEWCDKSDPQVWIDGTNKGQPKKDRPLMDMSRDPLASELHPYEMLACQHHYLTARQYLWGKRMIFLERRRWRIDELKLMRTAAAKHPNNPLAYKKGKHVFRRTHAQECFSVDVNKASTLHEIFLQNGWFASQYIDRFIEPKVPEMEWELDY